MLEGIQVIDQDWRYLYLNKAAILHARAPKEILIGKTMMECYPGIDQTQMFQVLKKTMTERISQQIENFFEFPDGERCWFQLYVEPHSMGIILRSIDITEKKLLEEQYQHAQKLDAVGRLAGGVAHDFNNKLSVITAYCELMKGQFQPDDQGMKFATKCQKAIDEAANLTQQLLAFARKQVIDPKVTCLNELILEKQEGLIRLLGRHIKTKFKLSQDLGLTQVDHAQVDQILLNLCLNAKDAMPDGGEITIETENEVCTEGSWVRLSVTDTGCGMGHEVKEKIFEPFFTTKDFGKGTGLGLSSVHGIVSQSGGRIVVESAVGKGSCFNIFFKRVVPAPESQKKPKSFRF